MEGPSLPTESPAASAVIPPKNLYISTFNQLVLSLLVTTPSTCGIPEPDISGSFLTQKATNTAATISMAKTPTICKGFVFAAL